ncbi:MAG TPA: trimethylamine methyltransferase family protein [Anaerolineae bacterium]|nr:trimethylamine methyltransferase family protein [Anaerolineae bacterium]
MAGMKEFLQVLNPDQVQQIHLNALRVLEEVGVWLPNRRILEIFSDSGAHVDLAGQTVRIPADLVQASIDKFPPCFTWNARNPANTIVMDGSRSYFSFPDSTVRIIDLDGNRRPGTAADGEDICRLCDALPNMSIASTGVNPPDMPSGVLEAWLTRTMYTRSSKPIYGTCRNAEVSNMTLRMAEVVASCCPHLPPGQLPLAIITNPVSPLYNEPGQLEGMMVYLERGLPISISPEVQAGATGPATLAGTMVQQTAEFLAHATLAQLVSPGVPVIYGTVSSVFDMKKMMLPYGAPEADLLGIATVQMARYYGIPARTTGGSSDANALGMEAGIDSLMSTLLSVLAGSSFVLHGAGEMENTMTVSYEKLLVDNQVISMARRIADGIEVTPETLGFDVIREVGPRGDFLGTKHTMRHFRKEQFMPTLIVRDKYETWEAQGSKRAEERARDQAREILATHQPDPLPAEVVRELEAIYAFVLRSEGLS